MINFLFCTVLPPGASKVDQTHKFDDFLDFTQYLQIRQDSVLIKIEVVRTINYLGYTVYIPRASEVGKIRPFCKKKSFFGQEIKARNKNIFFLDAACICCL